MEINIEKVRGLLTLNKTEDEAHAIINVLMACREDNKLESQVKITEMENKNNIKILVIGKPGSGKSTLTYIIKEYLRFHNFNVELGDSKDFGSEAEFDKHMENKSFQFIQDSAIITIEEVQAPRLSC